MNPLAEDGSAWRSEFAKRARPFRVRWRRQRLLTRALTTLWLPILGLAILLALWRFTLVDLPEDPAVLTLPAGVWLVGLLASYALDRPALARVAAAIDAQLGLDERLGTALTLSAAAASRGPTPRLVARQRVDALEILDAQGVQAARAFRPAGPRLRRPAAGAGALSLALLLLWLLPSPVAAQRAERTALRTASAAQADLLAALRRELVARPELTASARDLLVAQLAAAEAGLRSHPADRAANVAALSQADAALRPLQPDDAAATRAARAAAGRDLVAALQAGADAALALPPGAGDLERAAVEAGSALAHEDQAATQARASELALASRLEQAATGVDTADPALAAALRHTAAALRQSSAAGRQAMQDLARVLQQTAQAQQAADLLAGALGQLAASKQDVAQAGLPPQAASTAANRPFGPRAPADAAAPNAQAGNAQAGNAQAGSVQAGNAQAGNAQAATGAGPASAGGGVGAPAASSGDPSAPGAGRPAAAGAGTTGGATDITRQGNVQGGGGSGTQSDSGGQAGNGSGSSRVAVNGPDSGTAGSGAFEPVYVPGAPPAAAQDGPQARVAGVESPSQGGAPDTTTLRNGAGYRPGVKTPYTNVIGQYRDSAAQALDQTIIPADAKQYVRDYFDSLAPAP